MFIFVGYLIYIQVYINRTKRLICTYFYPKREKQRILHLYNKLLKKRRGLSNNMIQVVKDKINSGQLTTQKENLTKKLLRKFPRCCCFLKYFQCNRTCFICYEIEHWNSSKRFQEFYNCPNVKCNSSYCYECWQDINEKCLICEFRKQKQKYKSPLKHTESEKNSQYFNNDWNE